jgi:hypothetical protein
MKNARCFWMLLIGLAIGNVGSRADEAAASKLWAFLPIRAIEPPADPSDWSANAVDRFIQAKQRDHQLQPADPADKRTLLRRVTLDLLGLSRFEDLADQINQSLTQEIGSNDARFCGLWSNGWKWIMRRSASCARCPHAPLMTAPKGASCNIVGGVGATQSISSTVKHGDSKSVGGERGCVKL